MKFAPGRKQFNAIWFGAQGSGKTRELIRFVLRYMELNPHKRVLFIIPDDMEEKLDPIPEIDLFDIPTFTGIKKIIAGKKTIEWMRNYYLPEPETLTKEQREYLKKHPRRFNGLGIFDDPGAYIGSNPQNLYEMFSRRRQLNWDFISTFAALRKKAPPGYYGFATHLRLWETTDTPEELIKELAADKREEFLQMYNRVQAQAKTNKYHSEELVIRSIRDLAR